MICDCRALPGDGPDEIREQVERALGGEIPLRAGAAGAARRGDRVADRHAAVTAACEYYVDERIPGAALFPVVTPGFSDSHWVRKEHGTVAYGFAPVFSTDPVAYMDAAHGADEAIEVADLPRDDPLPPARADQPSPPHLRWDL